MQPGPSRRPLAALPVGPSVRVLLALAVANFLGYAARNALFLAYDDFRALWGTSDADLGFLSTAFMAGQAIATLPVGWGGDRISRKGVLAAGLALAGVASLAGAFAPNMAILVLTRVVAGIGTAAIVPIGNSLIGEVFDGPHKASRIAVFNLGLFAGGAAGFMAGGNPGYPWVLAVIGMPALLLAIVIARLRLDAPASESAVRPAKVAFSLREVLRSVRRALRSPGLAWLLASATTMAFASGGISAWLAEFLQREKHMTAQATQLLFSVVLVAALCGVITGARMGDRWRRRTVAGRPWTIVVAMGVAAPLLSLCVWLPAGPGLWATGIAGMFFLSWYHAPIAATIDELVPPELSVTAQATVVFAMHLCGTAPASWIVGVISGARGLGLAMWLPTLAIFGACGFMIVTAVVVKRAGAGITPVQPL